MAYSGLNGDIMVQRGCFGLHSFIFSPGISNIYVWVLDMIIIGYNYIDSVGVITNPNNDCGDYCTGLSTSVSFL